MIQNRIQKVSRWVLALFVTILVLGTAVGCTGGTGETKTSGVPETAAGTQAETTAAVQAPGGAATTETVREAETVRETKITVEENGSYTSKEEVALYLHQYGRLPSNFITKKEAEALGWKQKEGEAGQLHAAVPGMSIGGDKFGNYEGLLPEKDGRKYYECDINYVKGNRGAERIIYSNDGLIFYTGDHYKTFEQLYPEEAR